MPLRLFLRTLSRNARVIARLRSVLSSQRATMTSVLQAADYAAVGETDTASSRARRDKDREKDRKKSKKDGSRRKPVFTVDPLADFFNEQKRNSPPPSAAHSVDIDDGLDDDYSDDERKHRPPSPPTPTAPLPAPLPAQPTTDKKPRRSTTSTKRHTKPTSPHTDRPTASSPPAKQPLQSFAYSSSYSSSSLPVSYAARMSADDSLALREWLRDNQFDDSVWEALSEYSIADMLAVTKEDLKELLGTKQGIRLYARIQQYKQQQQQQPASSSPQPSRRSASSYSSASHSRYGACAINGCTHFSTNVCSMPSCNAALCMAHQNKSLLTGHVYCSTCERETWEGKLRHSLQSVGERAEETTERIINTTAEWTGTAREQPSTLSTTSRYGHIASDTLSQPSTAAYYQEEHKQHSPVMPHHASVNSVPAAAAGRGSGGGQGFMSDWLQRGDESEVYGSFYRERSWNDNALGKQCAIQ